MQVGGVARELATATSNEEVVEAVRAIDARDEALLVLAGGSNVVVSDDGFDGTVVHVASHGLDIVDDPSCGGVSVTVQAGQPWDAVVEHAVQEGWVGLEALSGIPGSAGATPIQNVGAYGQEVAQTIARVRTFDRDEQAIRSFAAGDCDFGYRTSRFRRNPRFVVLDVMFQFTIGSLSAPIGYAELARTLGVDVGARAPLADVRAAVLTLRAGKGMVLDAADADTRSAGSFFTNPVLTAQDAAAMPDEAPRWRQPDGRIKTSAAWLIEQAGFPRGYGNERASLSAKHTLAITNRGAATAHDVIALADEIRQGVWARFAVALDPEPVLVGIEWPGALHPKGMA